MHNTTSSRKSSYNHRATLRHLPATFRDDLNVLGQINHPNKGALSTVLSSSFLLCTHHAIIYRPYKYAMHLSASNLVFDHRSFPANCPTGARMLTLSQLATGHSTLTYQKLYLCSYGPEIRNLFHQSQPRLPNQNCLLQPLWQVSLQKLLLWCTCNKLLTHLSILLGTAWSFKTRVSVSTLHFCKTSPGVSSLFWKFRHSAAHFKYFSGDLA